MPKITVNGENKEVGNITTLTDLLELLKFNAPYYAVAINDSVVPRSLHKETKVSDGDRIEIIHAVGGG